MDRLCQGAGYPDREPATLGALTYGLHIFIFLQSSALTQIDESSTTKNSFRLTKNELCQQLTTLQIG